MLIYKILTEGQWTAFKEAGRFDGAPVDLADGYIHFSTSEQMEETAAKHFAGAEDLVLAWAETDALDGDLKWEVSRGGAEFPHLYRAWSLDEVTGSAPLPLRDGRHQFPSAP